MKKRPAGQEFWESSGGNHQPLGEEERESSSCSRHLEAMQRLCYPSLLSRERLFQTLSSPSHFCPWCPRASVGTTLEEDMGR